MDSLIAFCKPGTLERFGNRVVLTYNPSYAETHMGKRDFGRDTVTTDYPTETDAIAAFEEKALRWKN